MHPDGIKQFLDFTSSSTVSRFHNLTGVHKCICYHCLSGGASFKSSILAHDLMNAVYVDHIRPQVSHYERCLDPSPPATWCYQLTLVSFIFNVFAVLTQSQGDLVIIGWLQLLFSFSFFFTLQGVMYSDIITFLLGFKYYPLLDDFLYTDIYQSQSGDSVIDE